MKKLLSILWILLILVPTHIVAESELWIPIISREQWWADEEYTYRDSSHWKEIIESRLEAAENSTTSEEDRQKSRDVYQQKIDYINENFADQYTITETITHEWGEKLSWPIQKSDYVHAIIVHHTDSEYEDSFEWMRDIYRFHSLGRQWWDIGYNYIIGYDGEIFEWRKWWDYSVWAHAKWNNISTVGISVMWNYHEKPINSLQYTSLERLIQELAIKYGIDLSKNYYYNMDCSGAACNTFPLETHLHNTLSGHRHAGHTHCPWDELYSQMQQIRLDNLELTAWLEPVKRWSNNSSQEIQTESTSHNINQRIVKALKKLSDSQLENILSLIDIRIQTETSATKQKLLKTIQIIAKQVLNSEK